MNKFKGVLDGFRSAQPTKLEEEIVETLKPENFQVAKTFLHGFPHQPTALAFDPIQRLLAIGTRTGSLRILGRPGVDSQVKHEMETAVLQIHFLLNEGALITATSDDSLHLWNFRQKRPEIVHSLKFQKERITCVQLPIKSKWLYVGSERGNIHIVNVESFTLSGYVINWNKTIDFINSKHPGAIVHLSGCPTDENKLLIGYETGQIVLWNLRTKKTELRCQTLERLCSITWHYEGKQFLCAHIDGTLSTWNLRSLEKPSSITAPHSKINSEGKVDQPCKPIQKVEWRTDKNGESFIVFSGGTTNNSTGRIPCVTVMHGKSTTVLEMEHNIIDFMTLCENPFPSDTQKPYGIVILLQNDLVLIDAETSGFPSFKNPYPMDIHESPVTCCSYFADCPSDIIPAFYSVGRATQKRSGFSEKEWPISGGEWSPTLCSYNEIIITGHADGSVKFWDASAGSLQVLYKLKTAKIFEKPKLKSVDTRDDDPFSIQLISLCPESRKLAVAGASSHVILFKFKKLESNSEISVLEITSLNGGVDVEPECSPDFELPARSSMQSETSNSSDKKVTEKVFPVKLKSSLQRKPPGFQVHLVCLTALSPTRSPFQITSLALNSSYGLLAYGSENGVVLIDVVQKCCLLNVASSDLYGNVDPFQRPPRSPKQNTTSAEASDGERCRSPSFDQCLDDRDGKDLDSKSAYKMSIDANCSSSAEALQLSTVDHTSEIDPIETAQDALSLLNISVQDEERTEGNDIVPVHLNGAAIAPTPTPTSLFSPSPTPTPTFTPTPEPEPLQLRTDFALSSHDSKLERRASTTWRGFKFKKQLSKVDLKIKNTFSSQGDKHKKTANFHVINSQASSGASNEEQSTNIDTVDRASCSTCDNDVISAAVVPHFQDENNGPPTRPIELNLFIEEDDSPARATRRKDRKRMSLEKQMSRDTRLLSVPNIKYQHALKDTKKSKSPNNQTFFSLIRRLNKLDSTCSRSQSSSTSSIENISSELVQCLVFADSHIKKSNSTTVPTLWIGTSIGSVFYIMVNIPTSETRSSQPVILSSVGSLPRLRGGILTISFLDCNGLLIRPSYEPWRDERKDRKTPTKNNPSSISSCDNIDNMSGGVAVCDKQFAAIVSEKQAKIIALPSHECMFKQQLTDTDFVVKADVILMKDSVYVVCYISNGHIATFGLPSLKPLINVEFLPLSNLRIAKTFCFSNQGHGLYFSSPSEIQRFTVSSDFCRDMSELVGDIFLPRDLPEPPKQSLLKCLLGGGTKSVDREELFGDSSGKAPRSVAKLIVGPSGQMEQLQERVQTSTGEVGRAHQLMVERGDKLSQLEDRTQHMMNDAKKFASNAHELMQKNKDKKWYQL